MAGFETARAEAMKTCGPELQGDGYAMDTNGAFNNAKKNLEAKTGFIDKQMGKVDKQFDKVTATLRNATLQQNGQEGCRQVLEALQGAYKGDLVMNAPAVQVASAKWGEAPKNTASIQGTYNILKNRGAAIDAASGG